MSKKPWQLQRAMRLELEGAGHPVTNWWMSPTSARTGKFSETMRLLLAFGALSHEIVAYLDATISR